jgi:hypothetical protein
MSRRRRIIGGTSLSWRQHDQGATRWEHKQIALLNTAGNTAET